MEPAVTVRIWSATCRAGHTVLPSTRQKWTPARQAGSQIPTPDGRKAELT